MCDSSVSSARDDEEANLHCIRYIHCLTVPSTTRRLPPSVRSASRPPLHAATSLVQLHSPLHAVTRARPPPPRRANERRTSRTRSSSAMLYSSSSCERCAAHYVTLHYITPPRAASVAQHITLHYITLLLRKLRASRGTLRYITLQCASSSCERRSPPPCAVTHTTHRHWTLPARTSAPPRRGRTGVIPKNTNKRGGPSLGLATLTLHYITLHYRKDLARTRHSYITLHYVTLHYITPRSDAPDCAAGRSCHSPAWCAPGSVVPPPLQYNRVHSISRCVPHGVSRSAL